MAATTCFLGLVPTMSALAAARRAGLVTDSSAQESAFRDLLVDRRLIFGRSGDIMPLAGRTKADPSGTRWLLPAFPLDYVVDLISLVQVARDVGVPWDAMTEATDLIWSWRLPGGGWPMLGTRRLEHAYRPEPVNRARSSELITRRVQALGLPMRGDQWSGRPGLGDAGSTDSDPGPCSAGEPAGEVSGAAGCS